MTRFLTCLTLTAITACSSTVFAGDAQWGNLTGTIAVDGDVPPPAPANITKDAAFCGKHNLLDESVLVGPDGGLQNAFVWLYISPVDEPPAPHPSYAATEDAEVVLDNVNCRFTPHAFGYRTTQTLVLANSDPVGHSSKIEFLHDANPPINPNLPGGTKMNVQVSNREILPAKVACAIHPWMSAWVLVQDHPYFAVTDAQGKFTIPNLPVGEWMFRFWHEQVGYLADVEVNGAAETWRAGRATITINPGENDLGLIKIKAEEFSN